MIPPAQTLVVGDVHGCFDELMALIALAGIGERDRLVGVGDLLDRGPKSREVVEYFAADPTRRLCVRGNHENKHLLGRNGLRQSRAGRIVQRQNSPAQYRAMLEYFDTLPLWLELGEVLVVHAGLAPGVPMDRQDPKVVMGVQSSRRPGFDGNSPWWFNSPPWIEKPIVFGHEKHAEGVVRGQHRNVYGIDTGAALGGPLTGLLLPEFRLISVAVPNYWEQQQAEWLPQLTAEEVDTKPWPEVLALDPLSAGWLGETSDELERAREAFRFTVAAIEQRRADLLDDSNYLLADGPTRGELSRLFRATAKTDLDRLAIESLPHRDVAFYLQRHSQCWRVLRGRLAAFRAAAQSGLPNWRASVHQRTE